MAAALSFCSAAVAANVTIGPTLTGSGWFSEECTPPGTCTVANYELGGTGPTLTSPVTGAVVGFHVLGGSTAGTYRLRTVRPGESSVSWFFGKEAAPVAAVPDAGVQGYAASLPIKAGESVALTLGSGASITFQEGVGRSTWWEIEPPESGHHLGISEIGVWGVNAEVQPAPTVAALSAISGLTTGGTAVTITGTDLEGASAVSFGSTPATVTADSETSITATAPASAAAGAVPVTVTTIAGTATAAQTFTYEKPVYCVVPNLKGKKLAAAKTALGKAKCKVGSIKKLAGASAKTGKVSKQSPKAGSTLAVGSKVAITLKPAKPAGKKHKK
jgi:hypothetical protein